MKRSIETVVQLIELAWLSLGFCGLQALAMWAGYHF